MEAKGKVEKLTERFASKYTVYKNTYKHIFVDIRYIYGAMENELIESEIILETKDKDKAGELVLSLREENKNGKITYYYEEHREYCKR